MSTSRRKSDADRELWARRCVEFLVRIGLPVTAVEGEVHGFLPGVQVRSGGLHVGYANVFPGDILHEAGHLAVMPARFRALAEDTLKTANIAMSEYMAANGDGLLTYPEDALARAVLQADEAEAAAWQYAAAVEVQLPEKWLFPKDAFEGNAKTVLRQLQSNSYMGINGLQAAGWTSVRKNSYATLPVYPQLAHWLCPA